MDDRAKIEQRIRSLEETNMSDRVEILRQANGVAVELNNYTLKYGSWANHQLSRLEKITGPEQKEHVRNLGKAVVKLKSSSAYFEKKSTAWSRIGDIDVSAHPALSKLSVKPISNLEKLYTQHDRDSVRLLLSRALFERFQIQLKKNPNGNVDQDLKAADLERAVNQRWDHDPLQSYESFISCDDQGVPRLTTGSIARLQEMFEKGAKEDFVGRPRPQNNSSTSTPKGVEVTTAAVQNTPHGQKKRKKRADPQSAGYGVDRVLRSQGLVTAKLPGRANALSTETSNSENTTQTSSDLTRILPESNTTSISLQSSEDTPGNVLSDRSTPDQTQEISTDTTDMTTCSQKDLGEKTMQTIERLRLAQEESVRLNGYMKVKVVDLEEVNGVEEGIEGESPDAFIQTGIVFRRKAQNVVFEACEQAPSNSRRKTEHNSTLKINADGERWMENQIKKLPTRPLTYKILHGRKEQWFDKILTPGDRLLQRPYLEGINSMYRFVSMQACTPAGLHIEDANLGSLNLHLNGAAKVWLIIQPRHRQEVEDLITKRFGLEGQGLCSQFVRHENTVLPPNVLRASGISFEVLVQQPGELIYTEPGAYHQVLNSGKNFAVAINCESEFMGHTPETYAWCTERCGGVHALTAEEFNGSHKRRKLR